MTLEIITDPKIINRIEKETSKLKPLTDMLKERFQGINIYEIGGVIRDAIISEWYGAEFNIRDRDFIIDDSKKEVNLFDHCANLPGIVEKNRFGDIRWKINGYEIDIFRYSSNSMEKSTLEEFLKRCDFDTSAIAYSEQNKEIISVGALNAIRNKTITLQNEDKNMPEATLMRAVNFEDRLKGFKLSANTIEYIKKTYSDILDAKIFNYAVEYKKMPTERYDIIIKRLKEITNS